MIAGASGSRSKRVAAAVGEASMAIAFVHQYLRDSNLLDDPGEVAKSTA